MGVAEVHHVMGCFFSWLTKPGLPGLHQAWAQNGQAWCQSTLKSYQNGELLKEEALPPETVAEWWLECVKPTKTPG